MKYNEKDGDVKRYNTVVFWQRTYGSGRPRSVTCSNATSRAISCAFSMIMVAALACEKNAKRPLAPTSDKRMGIFIDFLYSSPSQQENRGGKEGSEQEERKMEMRRMSSRVRQPELISSPIFRNPPTQSREALLL